MRKIITRKVEEAANTFIVLTVLNGIGGGISDHNLKIN